MKRVIVLTLLITLCFTQLIMADIDTGLVHHWKFNDNTSDEIGMNDGILVGGAEWISGVDGNALKLLSNAYVTVDDGIFPTGNTERTISIVAQLKGDGTDEPIFAYGGSSGGSSFIINQGKKGLGIDFNGHIWGTSGAYSGWTLITVVIPSGAAQTSDAMIYINGQRIQEEDISGNERTLNTAVSGTAYIGSYLNPSRLFFEDAVDDLRIYNRALAALDIRELYKLYQKGIEKKGEKGWSPVLALEEDGQRRVLKLEDWIGGEGDKPDTPANSYIGIDGFTSLSDAIDIRGARGLDGTSGLAPEHEWDGTRLRFKNPDGSWGEYVDLRCLPGKNNVIIENLTLNVPSEYTTIQAALAYLDDKMITKSATVTIKVADGTHTNYDDIRAEHPNGERIEILGNTSDKSVCTIQFASGALHGLWLKNGNTLGKLDGFTFIGAERANSVGIYADGNSTIICGNQMEVKKFHKGVSASRGSYILAEHIVVTQNLYDGVYASMDSLVCANYSTVTDNGHHGLFAWNGSIYFVDGTSSGNVDSGVVATMGGFILARESLIEDNQYGLRAIGNGTIQAEYAVVRNNETNFSPEKNTEGNYSSVILHSD